MRERFVDINVRVNAKKRLIKTANDILEEYSAQGYQLTLRQLYYQFVARDLFANKIENYNKLGDAVSDGRLQGILDWDMIDDRMRRPESNSHWDEPESIINSAASSYALDTWEGQPNRVEVWVEKDALSGVIERPARDLDLTWFACRGYVSQSAMYRAAKRIIRAGRVAGQQTTILHMGDHDPSGIDMSRDIQERLAMFGAEPYMNFERIALNMDQIRQYDPPANPAKLTDSRVANYLEVYGHESWELDALEPKILDDLVRNSVAPLLDVDMRQKRIDLQAEHKEELWRIEDNYEAVNDYIKNKEDMDTFFHHRDAFMEWYYNERNK